MEKSSYLRCDKCFTDMKEAESLTDLPCIPYEWYKEKDITEKWKVYHCPNCKRIYRKSKRFNYYFNMIKNLVVDSFKEVMPKNE